MPAATATRVPFQVADSFVLALDDFMHRTRQGGHVSQSVLELDRPPDLGRLRPALRRVLAKHPLLVARPARCWKTLLPYWSVPVPPSTGSLPLGLWQEAGATSDLAGAAPVPDARELLQEVMMQPLPSVDGFPCNARLEVVGRRTGGCLVALSWSHLLIDGKGAELFLAELARLCEGVDLPEDPPPPPRLSPGLLAKFRRTKPAMDHLTGLQETGTPSLGGPKPRQGGGFYEVIALSAGESALVRERIEAVGAALFPFTFYVACVARAHDRVFRARGQEPPGYGISVPIQTRKRGARGPLFHNHVAVLYFNPRREHLGTLAAAAAAMKTQFAAMTRARISESFDAVLDLMRRVPTVVFLWIIRAQFKGEICSCFHSYTGAFAPELTEFAGARITNAYHLPCLGTPPGTGLFFGEHGDRINATLSWREGALDDAERRLLVAQLRADLLGETPPRMSETFDVCVAGGGSAGLAAAVAAARTGARTLLVERHGSLGGMASAAFVHSVCGLYKLPGKGAPAAVANEGFAAEFGARLLAGGKAHGPVRMGRVDVLLHRPAAFARLADTLARAEQNRLSVRLHTELAGADADMVTLACRGRFQEVRARAWVDATGDAVLAALRGAPVGNRRAGTLAAPGVHLRPGRGGCRRARRRRAAAPGAADRRRGPVRDVVRGHAGRTLPRQPATGRGVRDHRPHRRRRLRPAQSRLPDPP